MQNGVTFWTEGGASIGMGHVMRCINIAHALETDNEMPMHFLVNNERPVIDRLNDEALFHIVYPMTGRHANRLTNGVVVIDTKRDVSAQVRALREEGRKVVLIDNSSTGEADAIVMPTPVYKGQESSKVHYGRHYLIIGENFRRLRSPKPARHAAPLKVLITMGGSDPFNLTEHVLKSLWNTDGIEVTTVVGPAFKMTETMEEFMKRGSERFKFAFNVKNMAPLMREAHIAFTAVGTTVYELAYMGVPSVLIGNYETDAEDLASLEGLGICKSLGFYRDVDSSKITEAAELFRDDAALWRGMVMNARGLTDGDGASRIASLINSLIQQN
jgi:spore coat polysaccharide biosynthesis predicted glycosyltransferase SpsG